MKITRFTEEQIIAAIRSQVSGERTVGREGMSGIGYLSDVRLTLEALFKDYGIPMYLRSDNGSEFIARCLQGWLATQGTRPLFIEPGSPWQNGKCESFNGRFRDECLNLEWFESLKEAQVVIEAWRDHYNCIWQ